MRWPCRLDVVALKIKPMFGLSINGLTLGFDDLIDGPDSRN